MNCLARKSTSRSAWCTSPLTGAVAVADAHGAGGRGPGVGDGAGRGQHGHVEADVDVLDAGLVDAADAVGLRLEGHQLGVLLDHKDEVGLTLKEYFLIIIFPKNINFSD